MERSYEIFGSGGEVIEQGMKDVSWSTIRAARNQALAESDWRALKDVVLTNAWKLFRQSLRDLPENHEDANSAADSFPIPPE